jgi:hypothetical protein
LLVSSHLYSSLFPSSYRLSLQQLDVHLARESPIFNPNPNTKLPTPLLPLSYPTYLTQFLSRIFWHWHLHRSFVILSLVLHCYFLALV